MRRFRSRGWNADVASGAEEALRLVEAHEYEVLVTDLRMPRVDGFKLIEQAHRIRPFLACIVVSAIPDLDQHCDRIADLDIHDILAKPWDDAALAQAIEDAAKIYRARSGTPVASSAKQGLSVLLIEDSPTDAALFRAYLRATHLDVELEVAETLSAAVDHARTRNFDLIVCELMLPDAAGLDCVDRLRRMTPDAALVVLTGVDDDDYWTQALKIGVQDYIPKSALDAPLLARSIRYALERKRAEDHLAKMAQRDHLTGLANRSALLDKTRDALTRSERTGEPVALLYVDVDAFKEVNAAYGHEAGDTVIRDVSSRIVECVRSYDFVARVGSDQFAVLLVAYDDPLVPTAIASRILESFATPVVVRDTTVPLTAGVGLSVSSADSNSTEELLRRTDLAMRAAKRTGRNTFRVFSELDDPRSTRRIHLVSELRETLADRRFVLHYQPQFRLSDRMPVGGEALLRWCRRDGTLVSPQEFIPLLEDTGLIVDVGAWVIQEACRRLHEWRASGAPDIRVSVNLSAKQFESDGLVRVVGDALSASGIEPSALELEITEGLLMRDTTRTTDALSALKELGVRIALDDFGTGYSSLAYLERFDVDVLKIDRSFVASLETTGRARTITAAIIGLGHRLGLDVIAEGVETEQQLMRLAEDGCDVVQGFLLGRPQPNWAPTTITAACA